MIPPSEGAPARHVGLSVGHIPLRDDPPPQVGRRESRCTGQKLSPPEGVVISNSEFESGYACMSYGVWMTKAELAAVRGISIGSANRLVRHRRWERHPGDDGRIRVLVPRRWAEAGVPIETTTTDALVEATADGRPNATVGRGSLTHYRVR